MVWLRVLSRTNLSYPSPTESSGQPGWREPQDASLVSASPFRINTCKSVSKQTTLTPFRINTYEKHRGGGASFRRFFSPLVYPDLRGATRHFRRHMRHVTPLSPVPSADCAYFPSPRGCTPNALPISRLWQTQNTRVGGAPRPWTFRCAFCIPNVLTGLSDVPTCDGHSEGPNGRKYCVPFTGSCRRRRSCCRSALRSTKSISEVLITRRSEAA